MAQASYTGIAGTLGNTSHRVGLKVVKVHPSQVNDLTHVCTNPDQGRIVMRNPDTGYEYTTVPSIAVVIGSTTVNLVQEGH